MWKYHALLSAFFAALTAILAKAGVRGINGNLATAVRTTVILLLAWGIVLFSGHLKEIRELSRANILLLVLSGLATGLSWIFYFKALETGDVSKIAPVDKLSVVFVMILAFIFLHEPASAKTIAGGLLIVAGTVVLLS
ncbi:MAG: EamA family transporter [Odoribacteraceae bacterium]|jgi:transporter family protein|nr:EamA family transporter [Odoribacteraceae bacterium]